MKKFTLLFLFSFLLILTISAQERNYSEAKNLAVNFFKKIEQNTTGIKSGSIIQVDTIATYYVNNPNGFKSTKEKKLPAFYIFNRTDKPAFVIIAGDNRAKSILAYSTKHTFSNKHIPPGVKFLFNEYKEEIEYAIKKEKPILNLKQTQAAPKIIVNNLLIVIRWDQDKPYNNEVPIYKTYTDHDGKTHKDHAYAGCMAIAMGQIMYYYKHPYKGNKSHSYITKTRGFKQYADFGNTKYLFQIMRPYLNRNSVDKPYVPYLAKFIHHIGISVNMDYDDNGSGGSGAFPKDVPYALEQYFGYKQAKYIESKNKYLVGDELDNWYKILNNELDNGRPVIYGGDNGDEGHAWDITGRDDQKNYYMNFGWDGDCNGWYGLTAANEENIGNIDGHNFLEHNDMVIGIEPNPDNIPPQITGLDYTNKTSTDFVIHFSEPIEENTLTPKNLIVQGSKSGIHDCTIKYDPVKLTCTLTPSQPFVHNEIITLTATTGIKDLAGTGIKYRDGNPLDGNNDGTPGPDYVKSFPIDKSQHDYEITSVSLSNTNPQVGEKVVVSAIIKNAGQQTESMNQTVTLYDNGNKVDEYNYFPSLKPGEEKTQKLYWTPKKGGAHYITVQVSLPDDEYTLNNQKTTTVIVGVAGNLLIDGNQNPDKTFTLQQGTTGSYTLQLQNTGSADLSAVVSKSGDNNNLVQLDGGSNVSVTKNNTTSYKYSIHLPAGLATGDYSANILFSYENGAKTAMVSLKIHVTNSSGKPFEYTIFSSSTLIDGSSSGSYTNFVMEYGGLALFDLDNDPSTSYPNQVTKTFSMSDDQYYRLNNADWYLYSANKEKGSSPLSIGTEKGHHEFYSSIGDYHFEPPLGWFKPGNNVAKVSLYNYASDAAWGLNNIEITLQYSKAAWHGTCGIDNQTYQLWGNEWKYGYLYFHVDNVERKGKLYLYDNGELISNKTVYSSNDGHDLYFPISDIISKDNNFNIKGSYRDGTKVKISNIRLKVEHFTGEPILKCTKTLSKQTAYLNENVKVNLKYENIGSNRLKFLYPNDSPLPDGIVCVSGGLSLSFNDIYPDDDAKYNYTIKATKPGVYTFGATNVIYTDYANKRFTTQFNAVTLKVLAGDLMVSAKLDTNQIVVNDSIKIKAQVKVKNSNTPVKDAYVQCQIIYANNNTAFTPFYLHYNDALGYYEGSFTNTKETGNYKILLTATKDNYKTGSLSKSLQCAVKQKPYLTINPKSQEVTADIKTVKFKVNSNISWSVSDSVDWITSIQKKDDSLLIVSIQQNTSPTIRTGLIYITTNYLPDQVVTLTQDGAKLSVQADFNSDITNGYAPLTVFFSDLSSGHPTSWKWDFGDGETSTLNDLSHTYQNPGKYTVSLIVSNQYSKDTLVKKDYITVNANPNQAKLSIGTENGTSGQQVNVPVIVSNFKNDTSFQFTIQYDTSRLVFLNCSDWGGGTNASAVSIDAASNPDKIILVYHSNPVVIDSGKLFSLNFKVKNNVSGKAEISWSNSPTVCEVVNSQGSNVPCTYSNGAVIISNKYSLSGKLFYNNNTKTPLGKVRIKLFDSNNQNTMSDSTKTDGTFTFKGLSNGTYSLKPEVNLPWGGVSAIDITLYKKMIIQALSASPFIKQSGDVDKSGSLSTMDLTFIKQRIVQIITAFNSGDWLYNNTSITINGNNVEQDVQALCYGDANGSYVVNSTGNKSVLSKSFQPVFIENENLKLSTDHGSIVVPFILNKPVNELSSVTLIMKYPSDVLQVAKVEMAANNKDLLYNAKNGTIRLVYSTLQPLNLETGDTLMKVWVKPRKNISTKGINRETVTFSGVGEFGDYDGNVLKGIKLYYSKMDVLQLKKYGGENKINIYPNPTKTRITVTGVEKAQVQVFDIYGKCIYTATPNTYKLIIDLQSYPPGTYTLRVIKEGKLTYKKFVVLSN